MIADILKIYLIIGAIIIGLEWAILIIGRRRLFESEETAEKIGEGLAFFVEILIWPYQVYQAVRAIAKIHRGTLNDEELGWVLQGYDEGLELREKLKKRRRKLKENTGGCNEG